MNSPNILLFVSCIFSSTILSSFHPQPSGETPTMPPLHSSVTLKLSTDVLPWQPSLDILSNPMIFTGPSPSTLPVTHTPTLLDLHQNSGMHFRMLPSGKSSFSLVSFNGSRRQLVPTTCAVEFQEHTPIFPIIN